MTSNDNERLKNKYQIGNLKYLLKISSTNIDNKKPKLSNKTDAICFIDNT